jgi:hypothetical protein
VVCCQQHLLQQLTQHLLSLTLSRAWGWGGGVQQRWRHERRHVYG